MTDTSNNSGGIVIPEDDDQIRDDTTNTVTPDKPRLKHRYQPGNPGGPGRKTGQAVRVELPQVPSGAVAAGLTDVWFALAKAARKGDVRAAIKQAELAEKYADPHDVRAPDARYAGVPPVVARLLVELDIGLGEILHRHAIGLPICDVERLAVEAAEATRAGPRRRMARSRWADVLIREVQQLRRQEESENEQAEQAVQADACKRQHDLGAADAVAAEGGAGAGADDTFDADADAGDTDADADAGAGA